MKTKKVFLAIFLLVASVSTFAQLNPVQNFYFHQNYQFGNSLCPEFNCFTLTWSEPSSSIDTLLGYYIYQNNVPYAFTVATDASCSGIYPCILSDFYASVPFWISVRAVYNNDSSISQATDSIYISSIMTGIDRVKSDEFTILKNPVKANEIISLFIPYCESRKSLIQVFSQTGQIVMEYNIDKASNSIICLPSNRLTTGIYIICLQLDKKRITAKLIIE